MLPVSGKSEMLNLQRCVCRTPCHTALAKRIDGIAQQECARQEMQVYQRLAVILREMRDELQIAAIIPCPLCRYQSTLFLAESEIITQRMLQLTRRHFLPSLRKHLIQFCLPAKREMGE